MADAHAIAGGFGNFFAFCLIVAPVVTFYRIKRDQSVGQRVVYPYMATWCNAAALIAYAAPVHNWLVVIINGIAAVAEAIYSGIYWYYAEGKARTIAMWTIILEAAWGIFLISLYFGVFSGGRHEKARVIVFGVFGAVTAFLMYALLLFDTVTAWRTKDLSQMNILLVISSLLNCISWTIFAAKAKPRDLFILVSNSCGIVLTTCQAIVWVIVYFMAKAARKQEARDAAHRRAVELAEAE